MVKILVVNDGIHVLKKAIELSKSKSAVEAKPEPLNELLYRSLDLGEIILDGDEGSTDKKTWLKITKDDPWGWVIGMTVCEMVPNIRREI